MSRLGKRHSGMYAISPAGRNDAWWTATARDHMEIRRNHEGPGWAINGRFLTQRITGVQRYAREIVLALDAILSQMGKEALSVRLIAPPLATPAPVFSKIAVRRAGFGSGHLWDQLVLPF